MYTSALTLPDQTKAVHRCFLTMCHNRHLPHIPVPYTNVSTNAHQCCSLSMLQESTPFAHFCSASSFQLDIFSSLIKLGPRFMEPAKSPVAMRLSDTTIHIWLVMFNMHWHVNFYHYLPNQFLVLVPYKVVQQSKYNKCWLEFTQSCSWYWPLFQSCNRSWRRMDCQWKSGCHVRRTPVPPDCEVQGCSSVVSSLQRPAVTPCAVPSTRPCIIHVHHITSAVTYVVKLQQFKYYKQQYSFTKRPL